MLKNVVKQKTFSDSRFGDIPVHVAINDLNEFLLENKITPDRIISITKDYGYPNRLDLFYHSIEDVDETPDCDYCDKWEDCINNRTKN